MHPRRGEQTVSQEIIDKIVQSLSNLRFGSVQITVQDYRVVQIDKTEKVRFVEESTSKSIKR